MDTQKNWYVIDNIASLDTPSLAIYPEWVRYNLNVLIESIDDIKRLRPHIKTHKSAEVIRYALEAGIKKFKCSTIAEAEVLGIEGAPDVLLAYQPVGPKSVRLARLTEQFLSTKFSCLIDNKKTAEELSATFETISSRIPIFIDLNVGMNRTGILPGDALDLIEHCTSLPGLTVRGLHAYDGHIRDKDFEMRKQKCDAAFSPLLALKDAAEAKLGKAMVIVAGGTPTYSVHSKRKEVECSPGTFIYWDKGYEEVLTEQHYHFAALVVSRVISIPSPDKICIDLGHKAIASENPLEQRVTFLNVTGLKPVGHSEEHMVLQVEGKNSFVVGDVLYGVPFHICPTVALHQRPAIIENHQLTTYWDTLSRNRMITI